MSRIVELCEICSEKIDGMAVVWRRGFTAVCCMGCACEMGDLCARGMVDFSQPGAAQVVAHVVLGVTPAARICSWERPSFDDVTERRLVEKRPLWEALAAQ